MSSLSSLPRGEETTNKATEGQAVGVGGEEAKVWHWQRLQCLALAKKAQAGEVGQEAEGGEPGPVRGADQPVLSWLGVAPSLLCAQGTPHSQPRALLPLCGVL